MKITYIFEIFSFVAGIVSLIFIIRKDPHYLANRLAGIGIFLVGCHPFCIFLYDIINKELAVEILLRVAITCSLFGITLIFFTMQCMVKSAEWFKKTIHWLPFVLINSTIVIYLAFIDLITFEEATVGNINIQMDMIALGIDILAILFYLFASVSILISRGIKLVEDPTQKLKMQIFLVGLLFSLISIFSTVASQIVSGSAGVVLDVMFLSTIAVSSLIMMFSFLK